MQIGEHGGGVWRTARELGIPASEILDFSASINPLGIPDGVLRAAREALAASVHYPEIDASSLREALAAFHGLPAAQILPGSGSTELIYLFPRVLRPRRALLVTPAFSEYARALEQSGTALDVFPLDPENGFRLDPERLLHALSPETDLILFANPGNPTGVGLDPAAVEGVARGAREQALVAVDEAFVDFCPELSVIDRVPAHGNLFVFRSLTKFYAIPGLRAGYLAGPPRAMARLAAAQLPWSLSTPSLAAAKACLGEEEYRRETLATIPVLRESLAGGLSKLGLTVYPSRANFILARLEKPGWNVAAVAAALCRRGILIRNCANFPPLDGRYLRVAVRGEEENARLLSALEDVLAGAAPGEGEGI